MIERKKLFIAQPMFGVTEEEVLRLREEYKKDAEKIVGEELELLENYFDENAPADAGRLHYLGRSIQFLGLADYVYFAPNWEDGRGCHIERMVCRRYNIPIINDDIIGTSLNKNPNTEKGDDTYADAQRNMEGIGQRGRA